MAALVPTRRTRSARPPRTMPRRPEQTLRLFGGRTQFLWIVALVVVWVMLPNLLTDFWLDVLARCGLAAVGAIGLNLLTGYTGQISLGHAFFIGCGAYVAGWFGVQQGLPLLVWLPLAAVIGAIVGAAIGPFALRLRGDYLAIVTIGLLYVGEYIFTNWDSVTGGHAGTATDAPVSIGSIDFAHLHAFGQIYTRRQGMFWLCWAVAGIVALIASNIVRTRPGRAMQAVRDQDVAAEVVGVSLTRYKIGAFAVSSAMAAVAGGLFGVVQQFVNPTDFGGAPGLVLSITYVAMIIIGGIGTIRGAVIGAIVVVGLPQVIQNFSQSHHIPFVSSTSTGNGHLSVFALNQIIFGLLIIVFLLFESRGMVALIERARAWVRNWPF
ncbi:MAG TPA: branched-chain amino acid ABC transporter permease [Acidimicrobiia bacterium]|jgi:branched-chain amino acid transport system permease protein